MKPALLTGHSVVPINFLVVEVAQVPTLTFLFCYQNPKAGMVPSPGLGVLVPLQLQVTET